jgi:hypothetical protein
VPSLDPENGTRVAKTEVLALASTERAFNCISVEANLELSIEIRLDLAVEYMAKDVFIFRPEGVP